MPFFDDPKVPIRAQWARIHAAQGVLSTYEKMKKSQTGDAQDGTLHGIVPPAFEHIEGPKLLDPDRPDLLAPPPEHDLGAQPSHVGTPAPPKIAVIGAGAAGLFTGMIFDYLNKNVSGFHVDCDILEASQRVGGRLFTYKFDGSGLNPHLYYDVGAMRFPNNPVMKRTYDPFTWLEMHQHDLTELTPLGSLVPYYMHDPGPNNPGKVAEYWCFNDIAKFGDFSDITKSDEKNDPFQVNVNGNISSDVLSSDPSTFLEGAIETFRTALKDRKWNDAWKILGSYDSCSTRSYLEGGTGWYGEALSETVLESLAFDYQDGVDWKCILGGAVQLANKMESTLSSLVITGKRVTRIDWNGSMDMSIYTQGDSAPSSYAGVFTSTTLGCLKMIDTSRAGLNYGVKQAMRCLDYCPAAKVGIMFSSPWWRTVLKDPINKGGLGRSDLTIRTCVYPSYNILSPTGNHVLLCTFTWLQDAERISSLMCSTADPSTLTHEQVVKDEANLLELIFRDLARMHAADGQNVEDLYNMISGQYVDHFAHDWTHDPYTAGAFAFFKPQQFQNLWPSIIQPSNDLVLIGEAATPNHAWVVGALESAVVGVYQWLYMNKNAISGVAGTGGALDILENGPSVMDNAPFWGLPAYMPANTAKWNGLLSALKKETQEQKAEGKT